MIEIVGSNLSIEQEDMPASSGKDILSLIDTAKPYWGKSHIILPKNWIGENVRVALDDKHNCNNSIFANIATLTVERFGNSSHILLDKEFAGKRIFVERIKSEEKRKEKK